MWLEWCYFEVVLLLTNAALVINKIADNDKNNDTDIGIFTDVIRNISRVNNVLQDLIKNYEQLQNMYKAESLEVDYSSDSEIDEVFKKAHVNQKTLSRTNNASSSPSYATKKKFPGTEMIVSEEDLEIFTEKSNFVDSDKRLPLIERLQAPDPVDTNDEEKNETEESLKDKDRLNVDHNHSEEVEVIVDSEKPIKSAKNTTQKMNSKDHKHSDEIKVSDNIFYDNVHPKNITKITTIKTKSKHATSKHKKHKHKVNSNKIDEIGLTTKVNVQDNKGNVQKVLHTESFHGGKIWDEIVNEKPIKLKEQRKISYETKRDRRSQYDLLNKPRLKKTALVIVTKNKVTKQDSQEDSSVSKTDDEDINRELFKSDILRMAYGDACLKVVVKKCYKALKQVGKTACRNVKCKTAFKEKFRELSKKGCLKEFRAANKTTKYREAGDNNTFTDATRVGLEDCFPFIRSQTTFQNETPRPTNTYTEVNILRDRYERACQRASRAKCVNACKFAYVKACDAYECSKNKKKIFKKTCKRKCKVAYKTTITKKADSDSSNSDSGNDSDSESDDSIALSEDKSVDDIN